MIVVADTSVLLNLCCIGRIELLEALFHEVVIPKTVAEEFDRLASHAKRFSGLALPAWIRRHEPVTIPDTIRSATLDPGETAALALAVEIHADALLVDERRGHDVAVRIGLKTIGILGILLQAKSSGLIDALLPLLDQLESDAKFWISPGVRQRVLQLAGE